MKKSIGINILLCIFALMIIVTGLYGVKYTDFYKVACSMLSGIGVVLLEITITNLSEIWTKKKYPLLEKKKEREKKDERNTAIRHMAIEKTNMSMLYIYSFIIFTFLIMNVDLYILLLMAVAMGAHGILSVLFYDYYEKRM